MEDFMRKESRSGGTFNFIAISGKTKRTLKEQIESLLSGKKREPAIEMVFDDIMPFVLVKRRVSLTLKNFISKKDFEACKDWILLDEMIVYMVPSMQFNSSYSTVKASLFDNRLVDEREVKSVKGLTNMGLNNMLSMSASVHKADFHKIEFVIECQNSPIAEGNAWGSLRVTFKVQQSDECRQEAHKDTVGILSMPESAMRRPKYNPDHVDLTMDDEDLEQARAFYKDGRIIDQSNPPNRQQRMQYAQSEAGSLDAPDERVNISAPMGRIESWNTEVEAQIPIQNRRMRSPPPQREMLSDVQEDTIASVSNHDSEAIISDLRNQLAAAHEALSAAGSARSGKAALNQIQEVVTQENEQAASLHVETLPEEPENPPLALKSAFRGPSSTTPVKSVAYSDMF
jgi:hypothetical protein